MTIEELKKMIAENINYSNEELDNPVIFLYEKKLKNIIISETDDNIDMNMPFYAGKTTIEDSIIIERVYENIWLRDNVTFENVIVKGVDLSDPQIIDCHFYNCIFEDVNFSDYGYIKKSRLENCIFINCSFNKIYLLDNSFHFCSFESCNFKECNFKDSFFNGSKMQNMTLNKCKNIEFSDGLILEANN